MGTKLITMMITFRGQNIGFRYALLLFLIVKRIQFTWATDGSSSSTRIPHDTDTTNADSEIWTEVNRAIDKFIGVYQSQNKRTLTVDRELKPTNEFEAGLGFLCGTFRLEFSYRGQEDDSDREHRSSVIVKVPKLTDSRRYLNGQKMFFYDKEKFMYEKVLPMMYRPWALEKLSPQLHLATKKSRILFLENLHEDGFRTTGNDLLDSPEMCRQVMESLAQFHALSAAPLKEEDDLFFDLFDRTNRTADPSLDPETNHVAYMRKFEEYVKPSLTPRMHEEVEFVYKNLSTVYRNGLQASRNNGFNVILHGDPNRSNVFFPSPERRTGDEAGCKFIDFYHSRPGSPVIDLMNYLLTSVKFEVLENDDGTLFGSYVHEFGKTVREGRRKYELRQLYKDLRKYKSYFVYKLIFEVPSYWRNTEGITADDEQGLYDQVFSSERYKTFFKNSLGYLLRFSDLSSES